MDFIIKNVTVLNECEEQLTDVGVSDGRIVALATGVAGDAETLDMEGRLAVPLPPHLLAEVTHIVGHAHITGPLAHDLSKELPGTKFMLFNHTAPGHTKRKYLPCMSNVCRY